MNKLFIENEGGFNALVESMRDEDLANFFTFSKATPDLYPAVLVYKIAEGGNYRNWIDYEWVYLTNFE